MIAAGAWGLRLHLGKYAWRVTRCPRFFAVKTPTMHYATLLATPGSAAGVLQHGARSRKTHTEKESAPAPRFADIRFSFLNICFTLWFYAYKKNKNVADGVVSTKRSNRPRFFSALLTFFHGRLVLISCFSALPQFMPHCTCLYSPSPRVLCRTVCAPLSRNTPHHTTPVAPFLSFLPSTYLFHLRSYLQYYVGDVCISLFQVGVERQKRIHYNSRTHPHLLYIPTRFSCTYCCAVSSSGQLWLTARTLICSSHPTRILSSSSSLKRRSSASCISTCLYMFSMRSSSVLAAICRTQHGGG